MHENSIVEKSVFLEEFFDRDDGCKIGKITDALHDMIEVNIGSKSNPQMIKVGKRTTKGERVELEKLFHEFKDVFTWSYQDLKDYSEDVIQVHHSFERGI